MTDKKAKNLGFTHKGKMYGIPVYCTDEEVPDVKPKNLLWEMYFSVLIFLDSHIFQISEAFVIDEMEKI
ncbi:hypothetical protein DSC47_09960 [Elizabethkingia miricola]|uniref:hypothetical protein n=1 Tax=Elizabethkingia bruuniana TaxID=1756149 RepID=UPI0009996D8C|nr:hypothetical protein [Elizabethkingia bruuniana]OPC66388.1 hypothetical protein BAY13_16755 [Elizabethkingia bruuniana]RBI91614.1 hypothetical protein DSC47_09960 [Elizabethkingia miricola]